MLYGISIWVFCVISTRVLYVISVQSASCYFNQSALCHFNLSGLCHFNLSGLCHFNLSGLCHFNLRSLHHFDLECLKSYLEQNFSIRLLWWCHVMTRIVFARIHHLTWAMLVKQLVSQHIQYDRWIRVRINTYTARPVCWREWISWQLL